ncbi:MAG: amidohydrolase [Succinivibrio sp.]|nr:amidohydrolase [Succinivibrio sp.]
MNENYLREFFEDLHRHPELSFEERRTTQKIKEALLKAQIELAAAALPTGAVGVIGKQGPVIALRADIDALPVQEESALTYRSEVPGKMHACGHDFHSAVILGAALLLKEREAELKGRVKVLFQPAEEAPGGAAQVLKSGVLSDVQAIFGVHTIPTFAPGTLAIREGATHAAVDKFALTFKGKGTHAAHPDLGIDTTVVAAHFICAVQTIVSRNSSPFAANLVSVTHVEAGSTWNVIPEQVFVEGTVRTLDEQERAKVKDRLENLATAIAQGFGAEVTIDWVVGVNAMQNDRELSDFATRLAREDGFAVVRSPQSLGGEDFALYEQRIKGAFIQIGTGPSAPNHNPRFVADQKALVPASYFMAHLAQSYLESLGHEQH